MPSTDDQINDLIQAATKIQEAYSEEEAKELHALVERLFSRLERMLMEEAPPYLATSIDREAYMNQMRHKILFTLFGLGQAYQDHSSDSPSGFSDFIGGMDLSPLEK